MTSYERHGVSNHQPLDCLLSRLFRRRSKKTSQLRVIVWRIHRLPLNSPHKGPAPREMFYIWWRHHDVRRTTVRHTYALSDAMVQVTLCTVYPRGTNRTHSPSGSSPGGDPENAVTFNAVRGAYVTTSKRPSLARKSRRCGNILLIGNIIEID